jgi:hypothetical protein
MLKRIHRLVGENIGKCIVDVGQAFRREACETAEAHVRVVNGCLQRRFERVTRWAMKKVTEASKEGGKAAASMEEDWNVLIRLIRVDDSITSRFHPADGMASRLGNAGEAVRFELPQRSLWSTITELGRDSAVPLLRTAIAATFFFRDAAYKQKAAQFVASAVESWLTMFNSKLMESHGCEGMRERILNRFLMCNAAIASKFTRYLRDDTRNSFEELITAFRSNATLTVITIRQALADRVHKDIRSAITEQKEISDKLRLIIRDLDLMSDLEVEPPHRHSLIARLDKINEHIASHCADGVAARIAPPDEDDGSSPIGEQHREETGDAQRSSHEQRASRLLSLLAPNLFCGEEKKGGDKPVAAEGEDLSDIDETEDLLDETNVPDNNHDRDDTEAHDNPRHEPLPLSPEHFVDACTLCNYMYENDHGNEEEQNEGMYLYEQRVFAQIKAQGRGLVRWTLYRAERTIYLCFRGTKQPMEMLVDLLALPVAVQELPGLHAHGSILKALQRATSSIRENLVSEVSAGNTNAIIITGHSLGGAYALLVLIRLMQQPLPVRLRLGCITFGAPLVLWGENARSFLEEHVPGANLAIHNLVVNGDPVPRSLGPALADTCTHVRSIAEEAKRAVEGAQGAGVATDEGGDGNTTMMSSSFFSTVLSTASTVGFEVLRQYALVGQFYCTPRDDVFRFDRATSELAVHNLSNLCISDHDLIVYLNGVRSSLRAMRRTT